MTTQQKRERGIKILDRMTELLADPKGWTQGTLARDAKGNPVDTSRDEIVSSCLLGAGGRAYIELVNPRLVSIGGATDSGFVPSLAFDALTQAIQCASGRSFSLMRFNDDLARTHQEILAVLALARSLLETGAVG